MNKPHRISLNTNWNIEVQAAVDLRTGSVLLARRSFQRPTGISTNQVVTFVFQPSKHAQVRFNNQSAPPLIMLDGLATVAITDMMQPVNRLEIRWPSDSLESPKLPPDFAAWLEISNDES